MTTKLNIAQRINAVMGEVDYIQKEKKDGMQYRIVSHDAVTAKVRPILQKHGVVYYPRNMTVENVGNRTQSYFDVRFENIDDRSDFIDVATFGYGVDGQDKGPGKAMSYGVKYALLKVLGLETGDDPDTLQDASADFVPTPMIEDSQRDELQAMIEGYGFNILKVCQHFKIDSLKDIPADKFEVVKKYLNDAFDKKKAKEAQ